MDFFLVFSFIFSSFAKLEHLQIKQSFPKVNVWAKQHMQILLIHQV